MTGITLACTDGTVNDRLALQIGVAIVIGAGFVLHIHHRRAFRGGKQRNNENTKNITHHSVHPTIAEKFSAFSIYGFQFSACNRQLLIIFTHSDSRNRPGQGRPSLRPESLHQTTDFSTRDWFQGVQSRLVCARVSGKPPSE
jgi:hypothetical protein